MAFDLLERRREKFVLWIPGYVATAASKSPQLVLGTLDLGPPITFNQVFKGPLLSFDKPDVWELDPNTIQPPLADGVYQYWFEIQDSSPEGLGTFQVTDPLAHTVDFRTTSGRDDHDQPASVIKFRDGKLWTCDIDGSEPSPVAVQPQDSMPDNNYLVIYGMGRSSTLEHADFSELPTSWSKLQKVGDVEVDIGTFTDVLALFDVATAGDRFKDIPVISNEAIAAELGINALELLPAADAKPKGEWGYATAHYFSPDYDLGTSSELAKLVENIHTKNIRFFTDVVMAFGHDPYVYIAFDQFHISPPDEKTNPDSWQSHRQTELRDGYGGRSWRYIKDTETYDPKSGNTQIVHPSWAFHQAHLNRWMSSFGVGGLRLDSVNNIANYDFIKAYKEYAWSLYRSRYAAPSDAKFLVIGEELNDPIDMISSGTLNALWNEAWQSRLRATILGNSKNDNFDWTVRKMVNCLLDSDHPFTDGAQAINYITSHDTQGYGTEKERLYNFLSDSGVTDMERRAKFANALLLTSVGIPMIFAGEEFLDQMDRPIGQKQIDPVNYARKAEDWRTRIFNYIANLVNFRKTCPALGYDDTEFFHWDFSNGRKIMAWKRGASGHDPVVVVANFSDVDTGGEGEEYVIQGWPDGTPGKWREITQKRDVPDNWVGREPLMHWEVKVYTCWSG